MKTGNSNLQKHLITNHQDVYTQMAQEHGWKYLEKKSTVNVGVNHKMALPLFSPETFLEYLVRFVAADDQVSPHP